MRISGLGTLEVKNRPARMGRNPATGQPIQIKAIFLLALIWLGTLEVQNRPARMARTRATGQPIQIKASKKIAFRPAKELKTAV